MSERTSITPPIGQTAQVGYPCASRELGACVDMRDRFWVTWVSHLNGRDTIMARRWSDADAELTVQVSEATGEFINPSAIGMPHGILFLWRSYHDDGWRIRARALYNDEWRDEIEIAIPQHSISAFAVTRDANDEIWLMMATHGNGESSVWCSKGVGDDWSEPTFAFSHRGRIDRLRIASSANALWLAWDCYCDGFFHIWVSCNSDGVWEQPHSVSQMVATGDEWHLVPTIACDASGMPFVAWLMPMPVADNLGAYDHWLWLMCARYDGKRWLPITDEKVARLLPGCVESLAQGLLASETYVGYHGRRRHPMLIADERCGMWLLWERKLREDFDTAKWGVLCAKFYDGEQWHEPIELHRGALCYQVDEATVVKDGKLWLGCKGDPRKFLPIDHEDILAFHVTVADAKVHESWKLDAWRRWQRRPLHVEQRGERFSIERNGERLYLFWGDLHCHTFQSPDAEGELDEALAYARDVAQLDFCAIADNDWYPNNILTAGMWRYIEDVTSEFTEEGRFLAFSGYEWTYHGPPTDRWNHRVVIYPHRGGKPFRRVERAGRDIDAFIKSMCQTDAIAIAHHRSWSIICEAFDCVVEVCSGWQWFTKDLTEVMVHLAGGHRFGFVGNSDGHRNVPGHGGGLTAIYATELTPEAIFDALRKRRTYATTGARIIIDFRVSGAFIGEEGVTDEAPKITATIYADEIIKRVDIFRNGSIVHTIPSYKRTSSSIEWVDERAPSGVNYYHLRVQLDLPTPKLPHNSAPALGNLAWTSPIWVKVP